MGYSIIPSDEFIADYDETVHYLTGTLHSKQAAEKLDAALVKAGDNLSWNPRMMHVSYDPDLAVQDCREYPVHNYVIVYRVKGNEVQLLRLFHQSQVKKIRG